MLNDLLNLSNVRRWAILNMHRDQSVAEHSYRVACIVNGVVEMLDRYGITITEEIRRDAIDYALVHDAAESYTSDVPRPFKDLVGRDLMNQLANEKFCPWMEEPSQAAEALVKIADQIEGWTWWKLHGDGRTTHPWMTDEGPLSLNERTVIDACVANARLIYSELSVTIMVRVALTLCHTILGGEDGPATQIAFELKTNRYLAE